LVCIQTPPRSARKRMPERIALALTCLGCAMCREKRTVHATTLNRDMSPLAENNPQGKVDLSHYFIHSFETSV
jgi:hypothetical protein